MKGIWTIARRDLRALFDHPTGYILLVVFLAVNDFLFFRQAFMSGEASLRPMLQLLPWLFLFFLPAVTMRALAEDLRSGIVEVVLAQPVTELELVVGKYVGQLTFVWGALALTLPIPVGMALGAHLQIGVLIAQYVGAALLAAAFTAIGTWASSVTPNQITAFIVGVAVMFLLVLLGVDPIVTGLPAVLSGAIASLAVLPHFENIARGVIDLRDAVYFLTVAAIFVTLGYAAIMRRKLAPRGVTRRRLAVGTLIIVATFVMVDLFGRRIGGRLDLTPTKAFTLSPASKKILRNLNDLVTITLFASKELPPEYATTKRDVVDLLDDMQSAAHGNLRLSIRDPGSDTAAARIAQGFGVPPIQFNVFGESELQVKQGYLGLALQYASASKAIPFVQHPEDLEYRLMAMIRDVTRSGRPVIALTESQLTPPGVSPEQSGDSYSALRQALGETYDVRTLSLTDTTPIADSIRVVVLAGSPYTVSDTQATRFKAFLERGGGLLLLASGMAIQEQGFMASARPVGWNAIIRPYGVSIQPNMVFDLASNERVGFAVQGGRVLVAYPFWLRALSTRQSAVNQDIGALLLPWASSVDTSGAPRKTVTPLLVTSRAGGIESGRAFISPQQHFPTDSLAVRLVAALVNPLASDSVGDYRGRLVLVGNSDFVTDRYAQSAPEGVAFVQNAVDWLAQDDALISIRSKDQRPPALVFESATKRDAAKYGNLIGVPLLLVAFAGVRLYRRGRRAGDRYEGSGGAA
jgi:ABC-2 type transport system permease protein